MPPLSSWINPTLSILALGLAAWSLYLQRRDKRPRLKIKPRLAATNVFAEPSIASGDSSRFSGRLVPIMVVLIEVWNVGEKKVLLDRVEYRPLFGRTRDAKVYLGEGYALVEANSKARYEASIDGITGEIDRLPLLRMMGWVVCVDHMGRRSRSSLLIPLIRFTDTQPAESGGIPERTSTS